ncbi:hypothetical protein Bca4012_084449 [Brassica carinata]|uniref:MATH domain-containing protein n=1 Tax=Brassica carinata TaxID=52824 RepID=A0A8X7V7S5_BRACI|nr:hypothetical protein Bca52824_026303 [Brassica carinata]
MLKTEKSRVVSDFTITSKFGDRPPYTYPMKIQNLSQLKTSLSGSEVYKSHTFSSGKYNWRLVIYPKENETDEGAGFISLYVEIDSKTLESTVLTYLTFFVYNKKERKYFTIQDVEGKQFINALRPVHGFPQCDFGVDVLVPLTNWEVVSFSKKPSNPKFSWTLNKFSKLKEQRYVELVISRALFLYPKGGPKADCKSISIYLKLADEETLKASEQIYTKADLRIIDPFGFNHKKRKSKSHISYAFGYAIITHVTG